MDVNVLTQIIWNLDKETALNFFIVIGKEINPTYYLRYYFVALLFEAKIKNKDET